MVVLSCIAFSVACAGGNQAADPTENTEVNLVISDPSMAAEQLALLIDFVSYRITCADSGLTPYDDSVDVTGNFESAVDQDPAVWTLVTDLPLSACTIALWVFYEDALVCSGSETMPILDDGDPATTNEVNIALQCSLSVIPPSGDAEIDGTFDFIHGNYCPQLFWLGAAPTVADPAVLNIQTSYIDLDNSCGQNCDPQTCDFTSNPPVCNPAPDPGLSSTLSAPARKGSFGDDTATDTTYACDPLFPGPTEICVLVSDGDVDCDQTRCITIDCPDRCEIVDCDDANACTRDRCNPLDGSCTNDPAPDGIACSSCNGTCVAGACTGPAYTADFNSSFMLIQGDLQAFNTTLVNPYSGQAVVVSGNVRLNNSSYRGVGASDVLSGVSSSDVLLIKDAVYPQTVCGVETVLAQQSFDVMFLADEFITLQDMVLEGGTGDDLLWANAGTDTVRGNDGDDTIDGGPGDDLIEGGNGNDTITLWPGGGFDSVSGDSGSDRLDVYAIQSQILISPAANPSYEFDVSYLGIPLAEVREVELLVMQDGFVDLAACVAGVCDLCGNDALNGGEGCDDGNNLDGDGCAADCTAEY